MEIVKEGTIRYGDSGASPGGVSRENSVEKEGLGKCLKFVQP